MYKNVLCLLFFMGVKLYFPVSQSEGRSKNIGLRMYLTKKGTMWKWRKLFNENLLNLNALFNLCCLTIAGSFAGDQILTWG